MGYLFLAITHAPKAIIISNMLPEIETVLRELEAHQTDPSKYQGGHGYWDDLCLARFLEGVCARYVAYADPDAFVDPLEIVSISQSEAATRAIAAFESVFTNGPKIELDHYLVYYSHYELGRLLECQGDHDGARRHHELVLSGKPLEVNPSGRKGKYSMQNVLHMRAHAAVEALHQRRLL